MLGMKEIENLFAQSKEFRGMTQRRRPIRAEGDCDFRLDATGGGRHHKNSVAEKDRFFHVMRDKKGGRSFLLADAQQ